MKKQLLFTTSIFITGLLSAQVASRATKVPSHLANIAISKTQRIDDKIINPGLPVKAPSQIVSANKTFALTEAIIGNTYYDMQTNSSVGDRIVVNEDGTIAACWTFEGTADGGTYASRGTGYAYFNGTAWSTPPTSRVENARVGWGNIANTRSGKELIISHNGTAEKLHRASRATKGSGAWSNSTSFISNVSGGNWWPRMVTSSPGGGDTIYSISISYPVANGGTAYNGLDGALLFSRSKDGGQTWDIVNQQPTGFTSANFLGFGGDAYAIAAKGSTVAIVAGDSDSDVGLVKSTDGGVTWTYKTVYQFPIPMWDYTTMTSDWDNDAVPDTIETNDGSFGIALDNNGMAYVTYGAYRLLNSSPSAQGYNYFPYTDGLYLWNETMAPFTNGTGNIIAGIEDLGTQGVIDFPTPTAGLLAFGSYGASLTSFSSMAFDANNIMYVSYSSVVDGLLAFTDDPKLVRHVYVMKSLDQGLSWSAPYDVVPPSPGAEYEGMYPSLAKKVDGNVHLIYQRDYFPGYSVPPTSGADPDPENVDMSSDIVYVKLPVSDISNPIPTSVKNENALVNTLSLYPNPASTNATINVVLKQDAKMEIAVLNTVGQILYSSNVSGVKGSNLVDVDLTSLSAGMYFYQVKIDNTSVTKKFTLSK
ncbi:MAG: hypothetical protein K0R26_1801 [Bacteroidota bacterium]|jgi:hypothetical protein|nr:hypothetical protein [Bacteroidota bacterium]